MATSQGSGHNSSDLVKDYVCGGCESRNIYESADYFCATCTKFFCRKCIDPHDQIYANHSKYGRGETNKWPLTKTMEDLLLNCAVHKEEKLKMFCQDHSQLCCTDCFLLNHRQCTNVALISESAKNLSMDMRQLSNNLQTIVDELNKLKSKQEASIQSVEVSCNAKLQEIQDMRKKLNAALDVLENTTLKELDENRTTMQTSLKKDVENCSRLKDDLQKLSEAVNGLCDKSKKELEFIASRKCLDKIQESESYLKENRVNVQSSMIFKANTDIEQYLSKHSSLGRILDSMQSLTLKMNPDQVLTVKRRLEYTVSIPSDTSQSFSIFGICIMPSDQVIFTDYHNKKVKLLNQQYNVSSHCDVSGGPWDICQITSSEVAVTLNTDVQFISINNGNLVCGRKISLQHAVYGIAHHEGALYITSGTALYHYNMTGTLVKKLFEGARGSRTVFYCAVSPAGDKIYVTNTRQHKLLTLATDGTLISTFMDPELQNPRGVHVTPAGQVLVCGCISENVIQVDREGKKKLATLASQRDGLSSPGSVCYNTNTHQLIVGLYDNTKIFVMDLQ
ncbi:uncharacterized protein LOC127847442 isoform X2 [Dreissena polymorpha]|uniref:uncharacterized protein LOC127847442 isoform X2 n=1 Tax=Dreissena polymorpha TaxID=45954 RepID=UPI002263CCFC|nr:uncharacterized protein LOC127847442 isoform X2 [Dreissena polymorpha]XP_052235313.1 uncharacterized protein LOC127847442 isoform X3 [Dreissena polymorpha]XP_052235314.1 uncharacterized protein LOC127847442 isoform X2 [Dreissena polymorpha]XP_052235315.1 uncharacterized protein LOC127847442 isoform X2 [Dreissena polymorpha]XP_052235316.1 uncharacterized protein LOC127847442 isoform X2 [Dreissena polymorpha]